MRRTEEDGDFSTGLRWISTKWYETGFDSTASVHLLHKIPQLSRDSSVGTATGYGLDDRMIGVRFPAGSGTLSLRYRVHTGSGAHPTSYPVGMGGYFSGGKLQWREADHSPPPIAEVKECVELYLYFPDMSSWCGA